MPTPAVRTSERRPTPRHTVRVGSVSFLNAKPLIYGLEHDPAVELSLEVPSRLLDGMRDGRYDVALLPVIDYQRMEGLRLLTAGGIGCDGPTLTVRIFSRVPIEQVKTLACDTDSHTSVALARVLCAELYGAVPEMVPLTRDTLTGADDSSAVLLIGDKVVSEEPPGFPHQVDLGEAWKRLTGLPFLFAAWMARDGVELYDLPERLERARTAGLENVERIVAREAPPRRWPLDVAHRYLTEHLRFDVGPDQLRAVERFHQLAHRHSVLRDPPRPIVAQ
jgi:chorismate dehydratase